MFSKYIQKMCMIYKLLVRIELIYDSQCHTHSVSVLGSISTHISDVHFYAKLAGVVNSTADLRQPR